MITTIASVRAAYERAMSAQQDHGAAVLAVAQALGLDPEAVEAALDAQA